MVSDSQRGQSEATSFRATRVEAWFSAIDASIRSQAARLIGVRRHLHAHPEPSGEERATSAYVRTQLAEAGVDSRLGRDGLGVVADVTLGSPGDSVPAIALRADLDALHLQDEKTVAYASRRPGVTHACGHDAHTAIVLGTALAARELLPGWAERSHGFDCRLRFIFQPEEESATGARSLVGQGVLDGVESILGVHLDPTLPAGKVGVRYGALTASCDEVAVGIEGRGGHAARPHHTVDPIAAAAEFITACYQFLPRSVDSRQPAVFSIGMITGGHMPNVIPERIDLRGSLRTLDPHARQTLQHRLRDIAEGVGKSSGATIRIDFVNALDSVFNDLKVTAALERASRDVLGDEGIVRIEQASMGGEDFAVYLESVPGAQLRLGCARAGGGQPFLHSPHFDFDEDAIGIGARILLRAALLLGLERHTRSHEG